MRLLRCDRYGRRPVLLLCTGTQCLGGLGAMLVVLFKLDIWWFAPFFALNGAGGASWVFIVLLMAALADVATDEQDKVFLNTVLFGSGGGARVCVEKRGERVRLGYLRCFVGFPAPEFADAHNEQCVRHPLCNLKNRTAYKKLCFKPGFPAHRHGCSG